MARLTFEQIEQIRRREGTVVFNAADLFETYDALKEDHEASLMAANSLGDELRRVRAEQAELVAGAYLDAAECGPVSESFDSNGRLSLEIWQEKIRSLTPADAKAALERRDADKDATIKKYRDAIFDSALKCGFGARSEDPLSWMVATIERLQAELADAKQDTVMLWHSAICPLDECYICSFNHDRVGQIENYCRECCAIDAAKGGSQP